MGNVSASRWQAPLVVLGVAVALSAPGAAAQNVEVSELGYTVGDPDAPIHIVEFGDYACSACAEFHRDTWPALLERQLRKVLTRAIQLLRWRRPGQPR